MSMARHLCGWEEIRQAPGAVPPLEDLAGVVHRLLDPSLSVQERFWRIVAAGVGFIAGIAAGLVGIARRWSGRQATWGALNLIERFSLRFRTSGDAPLVVALGVWLTLVVLGYPAAGGAVGPTASLGLRNLFRLTRAARARLRSSVEAEWVWSAGFSVGRALSAWSSGGP